MNHRSLMEAAAQYLEELVGSRREQPPSPDPVITQQIRDQLATLAARTLPFSQPQRLAGQVWSVPPPTTEHIPVFVLVLEVASSTLSAMALSDRAWMATDQDVIVPGEQSPTGRALVVFPWRIAALTTDQLNRYIGEVGTATLKVLYELRNPIARGQKELITTVRAKDISSGADTLDSLLCWSLETAEHGSVHEFLTGPPLLGPFDPRAEVRQAWVERTAHLEALALLIQPQVTKVESEQSAAVKMFDRLWTVLTHLWGGTKGEVTTPSPIETLLQAPSGVSTSSLTPGFAAVRGLNAQDEKSVQVSPRVLIARLEGVELEIEGYVTSEGIVLSATAFFAGSDAPAGGVSLTIMVKENSDSSDILWQANRQTDENGVIHGITIPVFENVTYSATLAHEGVTQTWSW